MQTIKLTIALSLPPGVLALGLTSIIGLLSLLSCSHSVITTIHDINISADFKIPIFYRVLVFLLWLLINVILSGKRYFTIATREYWQDIFAKPIDTTYA